MKGSELLLVDIDDETSTRSNFGFLNKKYHVTLPVCALLFFVFVTSVIAITFASLYMNDLRVCNPNLKEIKNIKRRSISDNLLFRQPYPNNALPFVKPKENSKTNNDLPPLGPTNCVNPLDQTEPWKRYRLPTTVFPIEQKLQLDLPHLSTTNDNFTGTATIILKIQSNTYDIILHEVGLYFTSISVKFNYNSTTLPIDCYFQYPETEMLVIHLKERLIANELYELKIVYSRQLSIHGTGLFENEFYNDDYGQDKSKMLITHFQPVHARSAFPCFDEPSFKTEFELSVIHYNDTTILTNWIESESFYQDGRYITEFQTTPPISSSLLAFTMFQTDDFQYESITTQNILERPVTIRLWARKKYFSNPNISYVKDPLDMMKKLFESLQTYFNEVTTAIIHDKIDILAIPEYPSEATPNWGFIIFTEDSLLHNKLTTSENNQQNIALLIAKQFAEFWYGGMVSFRWWDELWFQEAIGNYLKYRGVDGAYPEWNIYNQFITEEMIPVMFDDGLTSSHPVIKSVNTPTEIDELFDRIETSKATAILRMAEYYMERYSNISFNMRHVLNLFFLNATFDFLNAQVFYDQFQIGPWSGQEFFESWFQQANYPIVSAQIRQENGTNDVYLYLTQSRYFLNNEPYYDLYPTNRFNYTWLIPLICSFGNDSTTIVRSIAFKDRESKIKLDSWYKYVHCDEDFSGYYLMDYDSTNWEELANVMINGNTQLNELNRAQIIHNVFMDARAEHDSYMAVRQITQYMLLGRENDYLPWRALATHVYQMLDILEFEATFAKVEEYFRLVIQNTYTKNQDSLWIEGNNHTQELLKNTIIRFACRLQLQACIQKSSEQWDLAFSSMLSETALNPVPPHARATVYITHFKNTYNDSEWIQVDSNYHTIDDRQERLLLLTAMTQSRQPWHLYYLLLEEANNNRNRDMNLLRTLTLISLNPVGRELAWYYYRHNWNDLQTENDKTNVRLGQLLIDITATFEDEFHLLQLVDFFSSLPGTNANLNSHYLSLERATANFIWIVDRKDDMEEAFELDKVKLLK